MSFFVHKSHVDKVFCNIMYQTSHALPDCCNKLCTATVKRRPSLQDCLQVLKGSQWVLHPHDSLLSLGTGEEEHKGVKGQSGCQSDDRSYFPSPPFFKH